jgi:hypothetical protein
MCPGGSSKPHRGERGYLGDFDHFHGTTNVRSDVLGQDHRDIERERENSRLWCGVEREGGSEGPFSWKARPAVRSVKRVGGSRGRAEFHVPRLD